MAHSRQLPSGTWQATVRHPSGRRITRTDRLKRVVDAWARDEEARIARGEWRDPRSGRIPFAEWRDRWLDARVVEASTLRRDRGVLRNHIDPHWSGWRLAAISRLDVQAWVRKMQQAGTGRATIRRAYNLMSTILGDAVFEGLLSESPCRRIDLPASPPRQPVWFTREQVTAIEEHLPDRHAIAVELTVYTGLRWGEMAGLRLGDVDWLRKRVRVVGAALESGAWKEYPKSARSARELAVPDHVVEALSLLAVGRDTSERLFVTVRGGRPWSGSNWRVVWDRAVRAAGVPAYTPHALRHTAASWLVQAGVPIYSVQAFLGHESVQTTTVYSHLEPGAQSAVTDAWGTLAPQGRRTLGVAAHEKGR